MGIIKKLRKLRKPKTYKHGIYTTEIGKTGLKQHAGYLSEEFLTALRGSSGIKVYQEMSLNDPIVGGTLFAIKQILRELRWSAKAGDLKDRDFLENNMHGMTHTWTDFMTEVNSMFPYGWSFFEQVFKRNEKGQIVWKKLPIRTQSSLDHWEVKENGDTVGMYQRSYPTFALKYIPFAKGILFRPDHANNNPEGRSILRNAYRPWYFKKSIEEIEAIGLERDLVGIPVMTMPEGLKLDDDNTEATTAINWAKNILVNIRNDEQAGLLLPYDWGFELAGSPGKKAFNTSEIIRRYSSEIAVSVLAQFIMLGMERTGSYALSKNITDMFYLCIEGWADIIGSVINQQAVKTLFRLNGVVDEVIPSIVHTSIRRTSLKEVVDFVGGLVKAEAIDITEELKEYLAKYARLEEFSEGRK